MQRKKTQLNHTNGQFAAKRTTAGIIQAFSRRKRSLPRSPWDGFDFRWIDNRIARRLPCYWCDQQQQKQDPITKSIHHTKISRFSSGNFEEERVWCLNLRFFYELWDFGRSFGKSWREIYMGLKNFRQLYHNVATFSSINYFGFKSYCTRQILFSYCFETKTNSTI